jgi:hypothetical protein
MNNMLLPVFGMFLLTVICTFRLGYLRFSAVRRGEVDPRYFRAYRGYEEPEKLRVHSRHLVNLFETPVLFYVIAIIALITGQGGLLPVVLAWTYVTLRYGHSWVHLTSNRVLLRFRLFALSMFVLVALWITVFAGILLR